MNIIIPDIDKYIVNLADLQTLAKMVLVNKFFHKFISAKPVMDQWKHITGLKLDTINYIFIEACKMGFLEYAIYLVNKNIIDIHAHKDSAFSLSCANGHLILAQWLIELGESSGYTKIDIHADNDFAFRYSCCYGHLEIAQWLIELGESSGYTKIDIHTDYNFAFKSSCYNGHLKLAQWLVQLGESSGYTKIDIHVNNDWPFRSSCSNGHLNLAQWLVQLEKSSGYTKIDIHADNDTHLDGVVNMDI